MKKILLTIILALLSLTTLACTKKIDLTTLKLDIIYQTNDNATSVTKDITLVTSLQNNQVSVKWEILSGSDFLTIVTDIGVITKSNIDQTVELQATLTLNEDQDIRKFTIIIKKEVTSEINLETIYPEITFQTGDSLQSVTKNITLPLSLEAGLVKVSWQVITGNAAMTVVNNQGQVKRGTTNITVQLDATLTYLEQTKIRSFILVVLKDEIVVEDTILDIYYLNDLHGAILENEDQMGLAKIGNLIMTEKSNRPNNTLFLSGGDMLQGTALSNITYGEDTLKLLGEIGLDAFGTGNHEFDWGLEKVTDHFKNGLVDYPILGANITYENNGQTPTPIKPYRVVEKAGKKIGIIGTIGFGQESSILNSVSKFFKFTDPKIVAGKYAKELREVHNVDTVILIAHEQAYQTGYEFLTGLEKIDLVFAGHTHYAEINQKGNLNFIQSGSSGQYVGHVKIDVETNQVLKIENLNQENEAKLKTAHPGISQKIELLFEKNAILFEEILPANSYGASKYELTTWITKLMNSRVNSDIAFHNSGGTRAGIEPSSSISINTVYSIFPFDNLIITIRMYGRDVKNLMTSLQASYTINNVVSFIDDQVYLVATNDYVFYHASNASLFAPGFNEVNSEIILRDAMIAELKLQRDFSYLNFSVDNQILSSFTTFGLMIPVIIPTVRFYI